MKALLIGTALWRKEERVYMLRTDARKERVLLRNKLYSRYNKFMSKTYLIPKMHEYPMRLQINRKY